MSSTTAGPAGPAGTTGRGVVGLAALQRIGRSLMLPIAVLPAAALLLRLGQQDLLGRFDALEDVAAVLGGAGGAIFTWLPLIFAVGVAVGFVRKADGSTALAAVVGYLVLDGVFTAMAPVVLDDPEGKVNYGVLGGIVIGITAALLWQRYHRIALPTWLAFFGGRRFVPIVTAFAAMVLGVLMGLVYPWFNAGLTNVGEWVAGGTVVGAGIYGTINRLLIPLGLHHIVNSAALTSLVTGITEPLEFAFMFLAWPLYVIHAVLTGTSLALANALDIHHGFGFSAGLIDYLLNFGKAQKPLLLIPIGLVYAAIYYPLFRFVIRKWNLPTPGREEEEGAGSVEPSEGARPVGRRA